MTRKDVYTTYVEVIRATELAVLVDIDGEEYWFPRSTIEPGEVGPDAKKGESGEMNIQSWIAEEKNLE